MVAAGEAAAGVNAGGDGGGDGGAAVERGSARNSLSALCAR